MLNYRLKNKNTLGKWSWQWLWRQVEVRKLRRGWPRKRGIKYWRWLVTRPDLAEAEWTYIKIESYCLWHVVRSWKFKKLLLDTGLWVVALPILYHTNTLHFFRIHFDSADISSPSIDRSRSQWLPTESALWMNKSSFAEFVLLLCSVSEKDYTLRFLPFKDLINPYYKLLTVLYFVLIFFAMETVAVSSFLWWEGK